VMAILCGAAKNSLRSTTILYRMLPLCDYKYSVLFTLLNSNPDLLE